MLSKDLLASPALRLSFLPAPLSVLRYPPTTPLPILPSASFLSVTRTPAELSLVVDTAFAASSRATLGAPEQAGEPWAALKVAGPLEHSMVGILAELSGVLRDAAVSIFAISTWDTDYVLVPAARQEDARIALQRAGWVFQ
ncbi:hypothetical protein Q5752_004270 [Cryptotrichosporon argae]